VPGRVGQPGHHDPEADESRGEAHGSEQGDQRRPDQRGALVAQHRVHAGNAGRDHVDVAVGDHRQRKRSDGERGHREHRAEQRAEGEEFQQ